MTLRVRATHWLLAACTFACADWIQAQVRMQLPSSARECALCHLDWMSSFQLSGEYTLIERPTRLVVNDPDNCLGCHDASVDDSRRQVWLEHGHRTGIAPPEGMKVPSTLPLQEGKVVCSTCHSAHGVPQKDRDPTLADVFFLRIPNDKGQLCTACHSDLAQGPKHGSHPVGEELDAGLPESLRAGGARLSEEGNRLICTSCHVPHGSQQDALLVLSPATNAFCLSCHETMKPEKWKKDQPHTHPMISIQISEPQRQALHEMGARVGENDALICSSCHKMHHAQARELLAETLAESKLCLRCHQDLNSILETPHNLAHSAPETKNGRGRTVEQAGTCSACHGVHRAARNFEKTSFDPNGSCATCHQEGQCAEKVPLLYNDHPMHQFPGDTLRELIRELAPASKERIGQGITCYTCHDPHSNSHGNFLRHSRDQLCGHCHSGKMATLTGAHDFSELEDVRNGKGLSTQDAGKCGYCHAVHGAYGPALWAVNQEKPAGPNELCLNCHLARDLPAHTSALALRHPSGEGIDLDRIPRDHWPLYDQEAHASPRGVMACSTCHDVHGDSTNTAGLLRHNEPAGGAQWCMSCHTDVSNLARSMHRDQELAALVERMNPPGGSASCAPCHKVHQTETPVELGMWAAPLGSGNYPQDMQQCLGCHSTEGGATTMSVTVHPTVPMSNAVERGKPGFLPLIDDQGNMGPTGRITCRTCHLPHGRHPGHGYPEVSETISSDDLARLGSLTRPFESPNLCSNCHGLEGLAYYLYYHFPEKRLTLQSR